MQTKRTPPVDDQQVREIAKSLDCLTEAELQVLGNLTSGTVEAWRRRGKGPAYILFGNRFYYPRKAVADFLQSRLRDRNHVAAKALP